MSAVRQFAEADIPRVAELHQRVFGTTDHPAPGSMDSYRKYFAEVFPPATPLANGVASLVCEERPGAIVGFLGVQTRRMLFDGRPVLMAVCSQFAVDPARRGQAGLRLLKQCLGGPQDLSLTDEAGDDTRRVWEWCGGATALLYSIHWIRPLRPARTALALLMRRRSPGMLARLSTPLASIVDTVCGSLVRSPLRVSKPRGSREDLHETTLPAQMAEFTAGRSLRPNYADGSLAWLLERASRRTAAGQLRKVLVRDESQDVVGWYVYYANPGGMGEVLQVAARKRAVGHVLDHLLYDAWLCGAIALCGRLDPAFAQELSDRNCLLYRRGYWTLVHSRRPELLHAIERGDAFLTRVEGEWCLRFR